MKRFLIILFSCVSLLLVVFFSFYLFFYRDMNESLVDIGSDSANEAIVLRFDGVVPSYGIEGWMKVFRLFEERENVRIVSRFDNNIDDIVKRDLEYGDVADVLYIPLGSSGGLTENMLNDSLVEDISDVMDMYVPGEGLRVREKIIPGFIDNWNTNCCRDSRVFLSPIFCSPCGFFYRRDLLEDLNLSVPKSFDEFFALGNSLSDFVLFTYPDCSYFESFFPALLCGVGGSTFCNGVMDYRMDAWKSNGIDRSFEIFSSLLSFVDSSTAKRSLAPNGYIDNVRDFMEGNKLFMVCGSWLPREVKSLGFSDSSLGFMAFPSVFGGERFSYSYFEQVFIPSSSGNKDLAKRFIAFLYSDEASKLFYENGGAMQPIVGVEKFASSRIDREIFSVYDNGARVVVGGFSPYYYADGADIFDSVYKNIDNVVLGNLSLEKWVASSRSAAFSINHVMRK